VAVATDAATLSGAGSVGRVTVTDREPTPEPREPEPPRAARPLRIAALLGGAALAAVAVLVAAVVLIGPKPGVAVIGDSITFVSAPEIGDALGDDWDATIDGRPGFTVADQLPTARALAEDRPEQVILNLGTNDVTGQDALGPALAALAEMVALFPDAECVHLVTVSELMAIEDVDAPARAAAFNEGVDRLASTDPRLRVIDWTAAVQAAQDADPDVALTDDTVHPSPDGQRLLADLYDQALAGCG
jgi:hypothetical protein